MATQPEALLLADELERDKWHVPAVVMQAAADELRRLLAENKLLHERHHDDNVEYTRVLEQRDALLRALERLLQNADVRDAADAGALKQARVAIKAVEGETK